MTIEQAIHTELSTITGLTGKVWAISALQDTPAPYCTYQINNTSRSRSLTEHVGLVEAQWQIDIFETTYTKLMALKRLVIDELKTWETTNLAITGPYIQECTITDEVESHDEDTLLYQGTIDITIYFNEN
jgi:hypothetical protein